MTSPPSLSQVSLSLRWIIGAVLLTTLFAGLALLAPSMQLPPGRYPFLVAASTAFLVVAWLVGAWNSNYGRLVFVALVFCWLGDVLGPYNFALGAGMFLLAHVVFVAAFVAFGLNLKKCQVALLTIIPSAALLWWLLPQVEPSMRLLVAAYTTVITVMLITAGGTTRFIFAAAVVFYVSDIFVARWRFVDHDAANAFICYPLYYTACLMFAISSGVSKGRTLPPPTD